jgi:pimeloyl-ACP methyl ester carboxylesterase
MTYGVWQQIVQTHELATVTYHWDIESNIAIWEESYESQPRRIELDYTDGDYHGKIRVGANTTPGVGGYFDTITTVVAGQVDIYSDGFTKIGEDSIEWRVVMHGALGETFTGWQPHDGTEVVIHGGTYTLAVHPGETITWSQEDLTYPSSYWVLVNRIGELFDRFSNRVNFNSLTDEQQAVIDAGGKYFDAGDGSDQVRFATRQTTVDKALSFPYFELGAGDDTIHLYDMGINVEGGDGVDVFDFTAANFLAWGAGATFEFDGGSNLFTYPDEGAEEGHDLAKLPGSPNDYIIETSIGDDWRSTTSTIRGRTDASAKGVAVDIEKIVFAERADNEIKKLSGGSLLREQMRHAVEVYGENLDGFQFFSPMRNWHGVSAGELGMKPSNYLAADDGRYEFTNGLYRETVKIGPLSQDAAVSVQLGVVGGKTTLLVTFRGTDDELAEHLLTNIPERVPAYYEQFEDVTEAIKAYLIEQGSNIDRVMVTGHSLGGGLAQHFAHDVLNSTPAIISVTTFGSIGSSGTADAGGVVTNFLHTGDIARKKYADDRAGHTVFINSATVDGPLPEHRVANYETDIGLLVALAKNEAEAGTAFFMTELAQAIRSNKPFILSEDIQIAPGSSGDDKILVDMTDDYDLGGAGKDVFRFAELPNNKAHQFRIDGGTGRDTLSFEFNGRKVTVDLSSEQTLKGYNIHLDRVENLIGGTNRDKLTGDARNNELRGLGQRDTLIGGGGNDALWGGGQADRFVFNTPVSSVRNVDTINDFQPVLDEIQLSKAIFSAIGPSLSKSEFYRKGGATEAHDRDDRIIYDSKSGKLYYDADGDQPGGQSAVLFAILSTKPSLNAGDFVVA